MITPVLEVLEVVVLLVGTGVPAALLLTRSGDRSPLAEVVVVAATVGVTVHIGAGVALGQLDHFTIPAIAATIAVMVIGTGYVAWRTGALRRPRLDRTSVVVLGTAAISLVPSGRASAFVFQTGDMGAYVNSSNVLADTASIGEGFPHGFTVLLAETHLLIGEGDAARVMPALGALLVVALAVLALRLTDSPVVAMVTAGVLVVHPTARWFALIPVSETLFGVVLCGSFVLLARARSERDPWSASVAGVAAGSLLVIRANAVAMVLVVLVGLAVSALGDDRAVRRVQATFTATATVALFVSYAYDVRYVRAYFVDSQLRVELPRSVLEVMERFDLLRVSPTYVLLAVVVTALFAVPVVRGRTIAAQAPEVPGRRGRPWLGPACHGTVLAIGLSATLALGAGSTTDALVRWHALFLVAAAAGVVVSLVGHGRGRDTVTSTMLLTMAGMGVVLYAVRLDEPMGHAYHLYWDRYVYGDAFLTATILAAIGAAGAVAAVRRLGTRDRRAAAVVAVGVAAGVAAGAVPVVDETAVVTRHELFGDSYGALAGVADLVPTDRSEPIVYTGAPAPPEGWFFPNTFRAYGLPLRHTFERPMLNLPADPFAPDPTVSVARARTLIAARDADVGFLLRVHAASVELPGPGSGATLLRTVRHRVWILPRSLDRDEEEYRSVDMVLELYRVDTASASSQRSSTGSHR